MQFLKPFNTVSIATANIKPSVSGFFLIHRLPGVVFFDENEILYRILSQIVYITLLLFLSTIRLNIHLIFAYMLCAHESSGVTHAA